jgi:hypothetical protein
MISRVCMYWLGCGKKASHSARDKVKDESISCLCILYVQLAAVAWYQETCLIRPQFQLHRPSCQPSRDAKGEHWKYRGHDNTFVVLAKGREVSSLGSSLLHIQDYLSSHHRLNSHHSKELTPPLCAKRLTTVTSTSYKHNKKQISIYGCSCRALS